MKKKVKQAAAWLLVASLTATSGAFQGLASWADSLETKLELASPGDAVSSSTESDAEEHISTPGNAVEVDAVSGSDAEEYIHEFLTSDGIRVTIESEDSIWSDETTIEIKKVNSSENSRISNLVMGEIEDNESVSEIYAYDITFYDNGEEFEPDGTIKVTFTLPEDMVATASNAEIFHVNDSTTKVDIMETTEEDENTWSCIAGGFSVYGIAVTATDYIEIYTVEDLQNISNDLTGTYYLMNDIDLSGVEWTPIGGTLVANAFYGTFDGQNHTISNLTINYDENISDYGLFCSLYSGSSVSNVRIDNLSIELDQPNESINVGGIAGCASGSSSSFLGQKESSISNCSVTGNININAKYLTNAAVGGIVGFGYSCDDLESNVNINISSEDEATTIYCGGIAGRSSVIINCINYGDIYVSGGDGLHIGGISGLITDNCSMCINYGNIFGERIIDDEWRVEDYCYVGGICGYTTNSDFSDCINFGNITAINQQNKCSKVFASGITAYSQYKSETYYLNNCFNLGANIISFSNIADSESYADSARISGIQYIEGENLYSLDSILVNGEIITGDYTPQQGENLSFTEMKELLYELYGLELDGKYDEPSTQSDKIYYLIGYEIQDDRLYLNDLLGKGFAITENTDTSFIDNIENWCGKYVYVVTEPDGTEDAPDNLISVSLLDTKAGLVSAVTEDAMTIDGVEYAFTDGCGVSEELVNQRVMVQVLNGVVVSVEALTEKTGTLVSYDAENSTVKVKSGERETEYQLSFCVTEEEKTGLSGLTDCRVKYYINTQSFVCVIESLGFSLAENTWSFSNDAFSFEDTYQKTHTIPLETYNEVYGKAYMDSHINSVDSDWGGNCFGMNAAVALFYFGKLDWTSFINLDWTSFVHEKDFATPNSYYDSVDSYETEYTHETKYYATSGSNSRVTRLIERYQVYEDGISYEEQTKILNDTFFKKTYEGKDGLFGYKKVTDYDILSREEGGVYIEKALEQFKTAFENDTPIFIQLQLSIGGHGLLTRTDKAPTDLGNGWWRVYVYDSRCPYVNEDIIELAKDNDASPEFSNWLNESDDTCIELNPSLNLWRYYYGNVSSDRYVGYSNGEVRKKPVTDNILYKTTKPEYFFLCTMEELLPDDDYEFPHFDTYTDDYDNSKIKILHDNATNLVLTDNDEFVAIVENGNSGVAEEYGYGVSNTGLTNDGESSGGRMELSDEPYDITWYNGNVMFIGHNNIINIDTADETEDPDEAIAIQVNLEDNSITMTAGDTAREISVKCSHLYSEDDCVYVTTSGTLEAGKTLSLSISKDGEITAETDEDLPFDLYKKSEDSDADVYMITIPSTDDTVVDNNADSEQDVESDSQEDKSDGSTSSTDESVSDSTDAGEDDSTSENSGNSADSSSTDGSGSDSTATGTDNSSYSDSDDDGSGSSFGSSAGSWILDHIGWWFQHQDGSYPVGEWCQLIWNGKADWYYFKADGYMATGWFTDTDGNKYYLNPVSDGTQGRMLTGWQLIDGKWYYFNEVSDVTKGALLTNRKIGEYFVDENGVRKE